MKNIMKKYLPIIFSVIALTTLNFVEVADAAVSLNSKGQFHIIDMGNVIGEYATWADSTSAEFNCQALSNNWLPPNGAWILDENDNISNPSTTGDIYGWLSLIDVQKGVDVAYNAQSIQGYSSVSQHKNPADPAPNIASGNQNQSVINR